MENFKRNDLSRSLWLLIIIVFLTFTLAQRVWGHEKWALLIGVGDYRISNLVSLEGPTNDIQLIEKVLLEKFRFKNENITVLIDQRATHTGIENAFYVMASRIMKGDLVYIHYSGHGSQIPDEDGDEFPELVDQTWVPYGSRSTIMEGKDRFDIPDDELFQWLEPIYSKAGYVVFVSDSCYSATMTRGDDFRPRTVPPEHRKLRINKTKSGNKELDGVIRIGAVQDSGIACEGFFKGDVYGLFSWYWAQELLQSKPGDTWRTVFNQTSVKVTRRFESQRPQFHGDPNKPLFDIEPFKK